MTAADGEVLSVRLDQETARELRWAAGENGTTASDLMRRGLRPLLAMLRANWYETHTARDEWEVVPGSARLGPSRKLDSSFGVRVTGEQLHELLPAAEAFGVPLSVFMRDAALVLAASMAEGGTAQCQHVALGGVTSADCPDCGPLPVSYTVRRS